MKPYFVLIVRSLLSRMLVSPLIDQVFSLQQCYFQYGIWSSAGFWVKLTGVEPSACIT
jgi:hypothetical protein